MRALTRSLGFVTDVARHVNALGWDIYATDHEDANGQFEQNFAVRRRARLLRPRDLLPLHGRVAGAGARADRDVHAEAVRAPDRQRLPHAHEPVGRRAQRSSTPTRPTTRAGSGSRKAGLPLHRRPDGAREGVHRRDRADRQLLQAPEGGRPALGRDVGARRTSPTPTTTARRCCASPARAASRTARSTAPATPTSPPRCCSPPGLDGIERELDPGDPNSLNLYESSASAARRARHRHAAGEPARRHARARARRRDPARARPHARRRLPRLLRRVQAARGAGRARADHGRGSSTATSSSSERCAGSSDCSRSRRTSSCGSARCWARCSPSSPTAGPTRRASRSTASRRRSARRSCRCSRPTRTRTGRRSATRPCTPAMRSSSSRAAADAVVARVRAEFPHLRVMSAGDRIEIFKEAGNPREFVERFGLAVDGRLARARPHAHGDREQGHDRGRAPVLDRPGPVPRAQRLALEPQPAAADAAARGDRVPDRERHRGRGRLPRVAAARGRHAAGGAGALPRRPRRLLHVRGRHGRRLRGAARPDRVQAGGDGRERRLGRDGVGVPRDRRAAGRRRRRGVGARAGARVLVGAGDSA